MKASLPSRTHGDFRHRRAEVSIGPIFARAMSTTATSAAGGRAHPAPGTEGAGSSRIRGPEVFFKSHRQLAARRLGCVPMTMDFLSQRYIQPVCGQGGFASERRGCGQIPRTGARAGGGLHSLDSQWSFARRYGWCFLSPNIQVPFIYPRQFDNGD